MTYDAGGWVDVPLYRVHGYHVGALVVPGAVFAPVGGRDLVP